MKFRFVEDLKRSLVGRLLIRNCVSKVLRIPCNEIHLERTDKGKPILCNKLSAEEQLYFNVSHAGDFVVLVASTTRNIGVDVMEFFAPNNKSIPKFLDLMKNIFTASELVHIHSFEAEWSQLRAFYRLWTLKESWVKATGVGIGKDIAGQLDFRLKTKELSIGEHCCDSVLWMDNREVPWCFDECLLDENHVVAVAYESGNVGKGASGNVTLPPHTAFSFVTFDEITEGVEVVVEPCDEWWDDFTNKDSKDKLRR